MISAQIDTAVSSGVRAPRSSPIGDINRASWASVTPFRCTSTLGWNHDAVMLGAMAFGLAFRIVAVHQQWQVPTFEVDNMLRQYVEPVQTDVFHYTRRWIMKMAAGQLDNGVNQIKMARQLDMPPNLIIPLRVIASTVAICCQLDAHVPVKAIATELVPGFTP